MSRCLHCSGSCAEDAVFCEACQDHAEGPVQQDFAGQAVLPVEALPTIPTLPLSSNGTHGEPLGSPTIPFEPADEAEVSPPPSPVSASGSLPEDPTLSRLNAAARLIAEEEPGVRRLFRSRSARLKPLRDISAEIQRASTPHPSVQRQPSTFDTQPEERQIAFQAQQPQHFWPWFEGEDEDEKGSDLWKDATDPFAARSRPSSAEAAQIEAADIQRIELEERPTVPYPTLPTPRRRFSRWHVIFGGMVMLALLALTIDGLLLTFAFNRAGRSLAPGGGPPMLVLSTNVVNAGGSVSLQLTHFAPSTPVVLTHDVQETLLTSTGSNSLTTDASGRASATFSVSSSWGPGFHLIVAEDVATRYTASAMLQVAGAGPSRPPHLLLDSSSLNLGSSVQGAATLQPVLLRNSGNGSISWSASSDQPWLLVAPLQGTFSQGQTIEVASQRSALPPGDYTGSITLFSNVDAPEKLRVHMTVKALPPNAGPVISLVPPLLSFTTMDGSSAPVTQVVTLSNPGQQVLHWSLSNGPTTATTMQNTLVQSAGDQQTSQVVDILPTPLPSWLSADLASGSLAPGQSVQIHLTARSQNLLPGAYVEPLTFSSLPGSPAFDTPQVIAVALTIQPHCGLLTSTGNMEFTAVKGQSNPSNHALTLNATASCANSVLNWRAWPSAGWITANPTNGQVRGTTSGVTSIGVNTANLAPGRYSGVVTFEAGRSTQTVLVQLNLQPTPPPSEPIMGASPLSLNFSTIQGQTSPTGQVITITNNGGSPLKWHSAVTQLNTNWLGAAPSGGVVLPGQTGQLTVNVSTTSLTPGNYPGQITLLATDMRGSPASGSPQTISVNLVVQPPCTLAPPSQSTLLFSAIAGGANPLAQTVTFTGTGSCSWPLRWNTNVSPAASWLTLAPSSGALTTASQQGGINVGVNASSLAPGTYSTQVMIGATDSAGMTARNSPQSFTVTLTVLQPCTLQPLPSQINLSAVQGQATPTSQTFTLGETGSCGGGVAWSATGDAGSTWLNLSPSSGTDTSGGSTITVSASAGGLAPGTYTGSITVSASNNGIVLQGSPQTITVTFVVSDFTVSGSVVACGGPAPDCTSSSALAGASVSLVSGGATVATVTADSAGNFTFTNVPLGTYTIVAQGAVGTTNYSGSTTVTVNGNAGGVVVQTLSS